MGIAAVGITIAYEAVTAVDQKLALLVASRFAAAGDRLGLGVMHRRGARRPGRLDRPPAIAGDDVLVPIFAHGSVLSFHFRQTAYPPIC
jgi:hypothetical protein